MHLTLEMPLSSTLKNKSNGGAPWQLLCSYHQLVASWKGSLLVLFWPASVPKKSMCSQKCAKPGMSCSIWPTQATNLGKGSLSFWPSPRCFLRPWIHTVQTKSTSKIVKQMLRDWNILRCISRFKNKSNIFSNQTLKRAKPLRSRFSMFTPYINRCECHPLS